MCREGKKKIFLSELCEIMIIDITIMSKNSSHVAEYYHGRNSTMLVDVLKLDVPKSVIYI